MFHVEQGDRRFEYRLIDDDRRVWFHGAGGRVMSSAHLAVLNWDGRKIPLEFDSVQRTDRVSGQPYSLYQFDTFGSSWAVSNKTGVGTYTFRNSEERAQALILAAEAVLVFLFRYVEGDWNVDAVRVFAEGREWRASDFGYRSSADIVGRSRWWRPRWWLIG